MKKKKKKMKKKKQDSSLSFKEFKDISIKLSARDEAEIRDSERENEKLIADLREATKQLKEVEIQKELRVEKMSDEPPVLRRDSSRQSQSRCVTNILKQLGTPESKEKAAPSKALVNLLDPNVSLGEEDLPLKMENDANGGMFQQLNIGVASARKSRQQHKVFDLRNQQNPEKDPAPAKKKKAPAKKKKRTPSASKKESEILPSAKLKNRVEPAQGADGLMEELNNLSDDKADEETEGEDKIKSYIREYRSSTPKG